MGNSYSREPMLEMFIFETYQLLEQLEQSIINSEKNGGFHSSINEIFRIMHTIKGSSAMMLFNNIAATAHAIEDLFYYLREEKPDKVDYSRLSDIVLEGVDFIKCETAKIDSGLNADGNSEELINVIKAYLTNLRIENNSPSKGNENNNSNSEQKFYISPERTMISTSGTSNKYKAIIFFEDGCEMENIRAFTVVHNLKEIADELQFAPEDIMENDDSIEVIRQEGFKVVFNTGKSFDEVRDILQQTIFLRDLDLVCLEENNTDRPEARVKREINLDKPVDEFIDKDRSKEIQKENTSTSSKQGIISVNITKLDKLMDLVGELVISEAMVTGNPDLKGLQLDNFYKSARQLHKITSELQDIVMSIRMVPLSMTFQKMNRIVRDMSKKLNKDVELEIIGEETEVDKNIIESISDPLMHLIRNSIDHGIESAVDRLEKGKPEAGKVTLEAKSAGGDVWIIVKDDGRGLNKEKILKKALENGLVYKPESELTDREIYSFIFLPGFSTKEKVTEFSGRGVGMDVVTKNIEKVGGTVLVDSKPDTGTTISIKIPLTLAIIDGMTIKVGNSRYTVPMTSIKESMRVTERDVITDPDGNEMILIRGQCHPILRLHEIYKVKTDTLKIHEGIIMMVEDEDKSICIFADELLGEQQVVVKALPSYLKKVGGIAGCTLLGDGSISLILDVVGLMGVDR
ncbi:MAG: chemotaxis protein CheA [Clostridia bacterium]|nr:chemotaxis protein CheA [Clostridia bacterium]